MRKLFHGRAGMTLAFLLGLVIATAGTATAARLISGKEIKDGSITARDLSKALRKQLGRTGAAGAVGPAGARGPVGPQGPAGTPDGYTKAQADAAFLASSRLSVHAAGTDSATKALLAEVPEVGFSLTTDGTSSISFGYCLALGTGGVTTMASGERAINGGTPESVYATASPGTTSLTCADFPTAHGLNLWIWGVDPSGVRYIPLAHVECEKAPTAVDIGCTTTRL